MENIVETLRKEGTSDCVAYTEFMLQYKKNENILYCFFEGFEDRTYYSIRIENISNASKYQDFICGGKEEVIRVHNLIKNNIHYKNVKTGFFVDQDFDSYNVPATIYQTPTYSIENLYCLNEAFEKIILSEFKINRIDKDFQKCIKNYLKLQDDFCQSSLLFNAWLSCQADLRNITKTSTRLKIDSKIKTIFEKVVLPDLSGIKDLDEINSKNKIETIYKEAPKIDSKVLEKKVKQFQNIDKPTFFRGKLLLRFLESYLIRLQSIFGMANSPFEKKYSCNLRIENSTMCSNLSQYAITPNCLRQYILNVSM